MAKLSIRKHLYLAFGMISLALGTLGIFLPLVPTTPFLLLAATCFMKSSQRHYDWLINHKWFGAYIRNYHEHRSITRRHKILTLLALWLAFGFAVFGMAHHIVVRIILLIIGAAVTIHIARLGVIEKTRPRD